MNSYEGSVGIMPHTDGPLYHPYVTVISIGNPILFKIYKDIDHYAEEAESSSIIVESGSLLIFTSTFYNEYLHAIQDSAYETIKIEYKITPLVSSSKEYDKNKSSFTLQLLDSTIQNLQLSKVYLDHLQELETTEFSNLSELNGQIAKFQAGSNCFTFEHVSNLEDDKITIFVSWKRDKRISITIRHVPIKDIDYPDDPTL